MNADPLAISLKKRHVNGKVVPDAVKEVSLRTKNEVCFRLRQVGEHFKPPMSEKQLLELK